MAIAIFIIVAVVVVWLAVKIGELTFNIMALRDAKNKPDPTKIKCGIVFNETSGRLEADQTPISPF